MAYHKHGIKFIKTKTFQELSSLNINKPELLP